MANTPTSKQPWLGRQIPRYTSYPAAPVFGPLTGREYQKWLAELSGPANASLYVHIPFCDRLCWFCGCNMHVLNRYERVRDYLLVLKEEIARVGENLSSDVRVTHLHFGGGSPTILRVDEFELLMGWLFGAFNFAEDAVIAVEVDPRTVDREKIAAYRCAGVNRASLGVQDFDARVQRAVNRVQPYLMVEDVIAELHEAGIDRVNFDLIYGLPHQTPASVRKTARKTLKLAPSRIALFGYAHVPWVKRHQRMICEDDLPGDDERLAMESGMGQIFEKGGYVPVGMDHYAAPDDALADAARGTRVHRNFQGYTCDDADILLGLGASSIGKLPQGYVQNTPNLPAYAREIKAGGLPTVRGHRLTDDDRLFGEVIERLMCDLEVSMDGIARKYGVGACVFDGARAALAPLVEADIVEVSGPEVRLKSPHRMAIRAVAACFDQYLDKSKAKYSRVA